MTYELSHQLKVAGFPQDANLFKTETHGYWQHLDEFDDATHVYTPTLSELIEACGDKFFSLERLYDGCFAVNDENGKRIITDELWEEETPEIAVAKLWLELNKK